MLLALVLACATRAPAPGPAALDAPVAPAAANTTAGATTEPATDASASDPAASPLPEGWRTGPTLATLGVTDADPALGPADARFTIVSFADYFCPHCAGFWPRVKELLDRNPDTRLVLKNYPIENACNPRVNWEGHRFACLAAKAAECAAKSGDPKAMADLLYLYPEHVTPPEMPMFAEKLGMDGAAFTTCLADPGIDAAVKADIQAGIDAGIEGTPAVFVRGLEPSGWVPVAPSVEILELALAEARAGRPLPK